MSKQNNTIDINQLVVKELHDKGISTNEYIVRSIFVEFFAKHMIQDPTFIGDVVTASLAISKQSVEAELKKTKNDLRLQRNANADIIQQMNKQTKMNEQEQEQQEDNDIFKNYDPRDLRGVPPVQEKHNPMFTLAEEDIKKPNEELKEDITDLIQQIFGKPTSKQKEQHFDLSEIFNMNPSFGSQQQEEKGQAHKTFMSSLQEALNNPHVLNMLNNLERPEFTGRQPKLEEALLNMIRNKQYTEGSLTQTPKAASLMQYAKDNGIPIYFAKI